MADPASIYFNLLKKLGCSRVSQNFGKFALSTEKFREYKKVLNDKKSLNQEQENSG